VVYGKIKSEETNESGYRLMSKMVPVKGAGPYEPLTARGYSRHCAKIANTGLQPCAGDSTRSEEGLARDQGVKKHWVLADVHLERLGRPAPHAAYPIVRYPCEGEIRRASRTERVP